MKKIISFLFMFFVIISCSQDDLNSLEIENLESTIVTKSSNSTSVINQLNGIPVNFRIVSGYGSRYLGVVRPGGRSEHVQLTNDPKNDIAWQIVQSGTNSTGPTYKIQSIKNARYIATTKASSPRNPADIIEYWPTLAFDALNAAKFNIKLIDDNSTNYTISFSPLDLSTEQYLCSVNLVDPSIYFKDLSKTAGCERWEITPSDTFRLKTISYTIGAGDFIQSLPAYLDEKIIVNQTGVQQSMTATFSRKATESSSFSKTKGLSITTSGSITVKIPEILDINGGVSNTTSETWQFGGTESREDSRTYSFPVVVLPYKTYKAIAIVSLFSASVTYVATFIGIRTNKEIQLEGTWSGVSAGNIRYEIYDISGALLRSFDTTPTSPVLLN